MHRIVAVNNRTTLKMVQVRVSEGLLEGELVQNEYGGTFCSFKGIPYAQPPLGDLRFKAPQPPLPWEGVRSAKEYGPQCFQYDMFLTKTMKGSEDCLYLNVYTPDVNTDKPLPVMVWIHGGGFIYGNGGDEMYGPELLIRQGVIVVTINYRLEVLGFLCLNTKDIPGNAGMKDQVAALRWVNKNIANFGGDPSNITIFGESAGGASVSYHLISPMSKGLFKRAIAQSGASLCHWAQTNRPRDRALVIARKLGFYSEDDDELYEFFKNQPVESLVAARAPLIISESTKILEIYFSVVDEMKFENNERFFYGDMNDVVSNGIHKGVEIMTGTTTHEGLANINGKESIIKALEAARNFSDFFVSKPLLFTLPVNQQLELGKKIRKFYFNNEIRIPDDWEKLVNFYSMDIFVFATMQWVKKCARTKNNKLYLYKFSCKSERNVVANLLGLSELIDSNKITCHADDVMYLFNPKTMKAVDTNSIEFKLIDRVTKLFTNFAKNGNPTPDNSLGAVWKPYTLENQDYLDIGNELKTGTVPDKEEIHFWESVLSEYEKKKIKKSCDLF